MLGLALRDEFRTDQMRDTAITFHRDDHSGALDIAPRAFFEITYPSLDMQKALEAISQKPAGRPVVLLGERGRGKSHIMAAQHHAILAPDAVEAWAHEWGERLNRQQLINLQLRRGYVAITESVHNNEDPFLWDILFRRHPEGQRYQGRFEGTGMVVPSRTLIEEMLTTAPTALLLDELQTWYDAQRDDPRDDGMKYRSWAFQFLQILSELAVDRPELLLLVVSLRNTQTDAYGQIHRNSPILVDFRESMARRDRQQLVLHRLFANRREIPNEAVQTTSAAYRTERFRLIRERHDAGSQPLNDQEVIEAWPFSPELNEVLEDQILLSTQAQGLRDLIRVLANVFRAHGGDVPVLTPADFSIDDDTSGVQSLLDAIATHGQEQLREKAYRNLEAIRAAGINAPHVRELLSALWMRSFSPGAVAGATARQLHLDVTRTEPLDDNLFRDELDQIVANSFNIHRQDEGSEPRYIFKEEENPRSRLLASARNDKLFEDGSDRVYIRKVLRALLSPATTAFVDRVIVLGPNWNRAPWEGLDEADRPERWESPVLIVMPELPLDLNTVLGMWLREFVPQNRNTVRFLLSRTGLQPLYGDRDILLNARAAALADQWRGVYTQVGTEFAKKLREILESRYDRYAVLRRWDYQVPANCRFTIEAHGKKGAEIASGVDVSIKNDVFQPEEFEQLVLHLAAELAKVEKLLQELREPPIHPGRDAVPYLGEREVCEQLLHLAAKGKIALNVAGAWVYRKPAYATDQEALADIRRAAFRQGRDFSEITLALPSAVANPALAVYPSIPTIVAPTQQVYPGITGNIENAAAPGIALPLETFGSEKGHLSAFQSVSATAPATSGASFPEAHTNIQAPQPPVAVPFSDRSRRSEPKTPLNLSAQLEAWGLDSTDTISVARLELTNLSVAELKQLLVRLPQNVQVTLEVALQEGQGYNQ